MQQTRVAVLRGGPSEEYHVSLQTGQGVLDALENMPYEPLDIVVSKKGEWHVDGFVRDPHRVLAAVDVVFLALHGSYGEDGTVQRMLDRIGVPYTGSGPYASSIAMNKLITKSHLEIHGVTTPQHFKVVSDSAKNIQRLAHSISDLFGPEYVIKPISGGSSLNTTMAANAGELALALSSVLEHYDEVMVEERIRGKEATCGVLENYRDQSLYALPAIEIIPPSGSDFFEASVKYTGETEEICPGRFSAEEKKYLEETAKLVHRELGLSQYSRSDFMIGENGIYFLEVNTLPGLTSESLLPKSVEAVGSSYGQLIDHLLTQSLQRR